VRFNSLFSVQRIQRTESSPHQRQDSESRLRKSSELYKDSISTAGVESSELCSPPTNVTSSSFGVVQSVQTAENKRKPNWPTFATARLLGMPWYAALD